MNIKNMFACALALAVVAGAPMSYADEDAPKGDAAVKAVKKLKPFNARINKKAKFFIYLQSASWCGPCNAEMPGLAKMYPEMKRAGVELILCSCDRDEESAKGFLKKYKAKFPAIMAAEASGLPGFTPARGIPNAIIVDADGNVLQQGHGAIIKGWKNICVSSDDEDDASDKPAKSKKSKKD